MAHSTLLTFATAADGAQLQCAIYKPQTAPPWPAAGVIHGGGFKGGGPNNPDLVACCKDLAAAGIMAIANTYRLDKQRIPGQTDTGKWPQQTYDCMDFIKWIRNRPDCNGIVDVIGGSAGATHAFSVTTQTSAPGWNSGDRARRGVCLSGAYDFADRTPDPGLSVAVANFNLYCGTSVISEMRNMSPITLMDGTANPLLLRASVSDPMPHGQWTSVLARLAALGLTADTRLLPGTLHEFAYWPSVKNEVIAFLKAA